MKLFERIFSLAVFTVIGGWFYVVIYITEPFTIESGVFLFISIFSLLFVLISSFNKSRIYHRFGYNFSKPRFSKSLFGWRTYKRTREDDFSLFGLLRGDSRHAMLHRLLRNKASEQREMNCTVCDKPVKDDSIKKAYFVETRRAFFFFGLPYLGKTIQEEAYCENHLP